MVSQVGCGSRKNLLHLRIGVIQTHQWLFWYDIKLREFEAPAWENHFIDIAPKSTRALRGSTWKGFNYGLDWTVCGYKWLMFN